MSKRGALDAFFQPSKKPKQEQSETPQNSSLRGEAEDLLKSPLPSTRHPTYPFPVPQLPPEVLSFLDYAPAAEGRRIHDQPDLDLVYYEPFVPAAVAKQLFRFLRNELFFYRVQYKIKRGPTETQINTPRYTTVFGVDETSTWSNATSTASQTLLEATTKKPVAANKYQRQPRPIPECLDTLRRVTEAVTGETFNFCLVNYYASGADSISYHSDDERFLGKDPSIASFSLGARRDFLMKHKPVPGADGKPDEKEAKEKPLKLPLASGDMILMRGRTQSNWLHSIPKRKGGEADSGRINITFRKALVKAGTENYYQYNVGTGGVFKYNDTAKQMLLYTPST